LIKERIAKNVPWKWNLLHATVDRQLTSDVSTRRLRSTDSAMCVDPTFK